MSGASDGGPGWGAAAWECIVFLLFVVGSTCAPLCRWRRAPKGKAEAPVEAAQAKLDFVFATGSVSAVAIVLSIARGTLGVRSFLGFPAELVYRGAGMWETIVGICLALPLVGMLLVPLFLERPTASVYEYLQARFRSHAVRRAAAATFVLRQLLNLAVTAYTPVVALAAVGAPPAAAAAALAAAAAAAMLAGGFTQIIRADVLQTVSMVAISVVFLAQAGWRAGGPAAAWHAAREDGRLDFFNFTWDPRTRVDTLSAVVGQLFMSLSVYGCQQTFVQRYVSLGSARAARRALLAAAPAVAVLFSLSWLVGVALYAVYQDCNPLATGAFSTPDQLLPYYVRDQLAVAPGMMGLFLGCLFNGALSFLVSNINSLATVTWEDFVSHAAPFRGLTDRQQLAVIKSIAVLYAVLIMLLSLGVGRVGGVVEGSQLVTAATAGALLGVFVLAAACPLAGGRGALAGMIVAHALVGALATGRFLLAPDALPMLPLRTDGCDNVTLARLEQLERPVPLSVLQQLLLPSPTPTAAPSAAWAALQYTCELSYMWYAVLGTLACVLVGNVVGTLAPEMPFDDALLHPMAARLVRRLPSLGPPRTFRAGDKEPSAPTPITVTGALPAAALVAAPPIVPSPRAPSTLPTLARALGAPLKAAAAPGAPAPPPAPALSSCRLFDAYTPQSPHMTPRASTPRARF